MTAMPGNWGSTVASTAVSPPTDFILRGSEGGFCQVRCFRENPLTGDARISGTAHWQAWRALRSNDWENRSKASGAFCLLYSVT